MSTDPTPPPAWSRQLIAELQGADQRAVALARGLSVDGLLRSRRSRPGEIIAKHEDRHVLQAERVWEAWADTSGRA